MYALVGKGIAGIGAVIMLSGLVVNPWVGVYYQDYIENYRDVMLAYVWWSLGLGLLLVVLGFYAARRARERWTGVAMTLTILSLVVLVDRALLVVFGLPNWIADPVVGYRHRPNVVRVLGSRLLPSHNERLRGMRYVFNKYGHHDDDFPQVKPQFELRGLMLGDSVTMGDGVEKDDTIASQLEDILYARDNKYADCQVINTGVGGYSTSQEYAILRESLVFSPDFATVGVCLNDIIDAKPDDIGSNSGIAYLYESIAGYGANEIGFSRLIAWAMAPSESLEQRGLSQTHRLREMASASSDDARFEVGWKLVLENLAAIYRLAREQDIEMVLLVYPFASQLFVEKLQRPQQILLQHADTHGVGVIDFTQIFEEAIRTDVEQILAGLDPTRAMTPEDMDLILAFQVNRYFMDEVHPTPIGNRLAAGHLAEYLHHKELVELDLPAFHREQRLIIEHDPGEFTVNMPHTQQEIAHTAYVLFLLQQDMEKIRRVVEIGLRAADTSQSRAQFYRVLGEMERARGNEEAAATALPLVEQQ